MKDGVIVVAVVESNNKSIELKTDDHQILNPKALDNKKAHFWSYPRHT